MYENERSLVKSLASQPSMVSSTGHQYSLSNRRHPAFARRSHCQDPDDVRLPIYQTDRNGVSGKGKQHFLVFLAVVPFWMCFSVTLKAVVLS